MKINPTDTPGRWRLAAAAALLISPSAHAVLALPMTGPEEFHAARASALPALPELQATSRALPLSFRSVAGATLPLSAEPAAGTLDLSLWRFIRSVKYQQAGNSFALLDSNLRIFEGIGPQAVAAVPLPGAAWLLVTGLMGLVGVKINGRQARLRDGAVPTGATDGRLPAT